LGRDAVTVIPAVSSVQEAFARAGLAWESARVLSAHGRELEPVVAQTLATTTAAILCGPGNPPERVARALLDAGIEDCRAVAAAGLAPGARVFAVERDPAQLEHLRSNAATLGGGAVSVVAGAAPVALEALPDPDRVVVGGHGGRLGEILGVVHSRLRPGGTVVCSFAAVERPLVARALVGRWN